MATVAAYAFYGLRVDAGWPWPLAFLTVLAAGSLLGGWLFASLAQALARVGLAMKVAATVGVLLIVQAGVEIIAGQESKSVPSYLPQGSLTLAGTVIAYDKLTVIALAAAATAGLWVYFRTARLGLAMRAVVDDAALLDISGTSPRRVRVSAWTVGVGFAVLSGLLLSPFVPLDSTTLTLLVVQAFGAAALGAFSSLPMTFAGGLVIGVAGSVATKYLTGGPFEQLPASLPFLVLFLALLAFPKRWLQINVAEPLSTRSLWTLPTRYQAALGGMALLGLALVPQFESFRLSAWTTGLTSVLLFVSLGVLTRVSGQVSLCHVGFAAIGAATFHHLSVGQGWPWALALGGAALVAAPIGAVLAIPAARLGGLYLALATMGFGIALAQLGYTSDLMFGSSGLGLDMPRPGFLGLSSDVNFYYLVLAIVSVLTLGVVALERTRMGRLLRGMSGSSLAVSTSGASVNVTRVLVFCLSASLAAVSGALAGMTQFLASAENYPPLMSLTYLAFVLVALGGSPWYAVQAGLLFSVLPAYFTSPDVSTYLALAAGSAVLLRAVRPLPAAPVSLQRVLGSPVVKKRPTRGTGLGEPGRQGSDLLKLDVSGLTVRFGGLTAVRDVSLSARSGRIVGLIGPNGAGKTSTFNALSGLVRASNGAILLDGSRVNRSTPPSRARAGLGRSFQVAQLLDEQSVRSNIAMSPEALFAGRSPLRHIVPRRGEARRVDVVTADALTLCGLEDLAEHRVADLSTGQRRLVELARCVAGGYRLLLLDEPSSGLDVQETAAFGDVLLRVVQERNTGILLVEHDMTLVNRVCDEVFVLDFGELIHSGPTSQVLASEQVRAAYLGAETPAATAEVTREGAST